MSEKYRDPNDNYSKNIIYKIIHKEKPELFAVGSTCQSEKERWRHHVDDYLARKFTEKHKLYNAFKQYGHENFMMTKIEDWPCANYDEARIRERYWYDKLGATLNTNRPYATKEEILEKKLEKSLEKFECEDCGMETCQAHMSNHKKSESHTHLSEVRKNIKEGTDQKIDTYLTLETGKILCSCYLEFIRKDSYDRHIRVGTAHNKYMKIINQYRLETNNNNMINTTNEEIICECGIKLKSRDYQHHLTIKLHEDLMEIRHRIELELDGKRIPIQEDYVLCNDCYKLYKLKDATYHKNTQKHKDYPDIIKNIRRLLNEKNKSGNENKKFNDLKYALDETKTIEMKDQTIDLVKINIKINTDIMCECGDTVSESMNKKHLSSKRHKDLMEIRERIEMENDKKEIELKDNQLLCDKCYWIYDKEKPGRHNDSQIHQEYSKIVPIIKRLLKKKKQPGNENKKFKELENDLVKVDILPMIM